MTPLTREQYKAHLVELVGAIVQVHGELTVRAVQEIANQEIITRGIIGAAERVREKAGMRA